MNNNKGQGAIEYLLIIGAAILVVAVVIVAITGVLGAGKDNANIDAVVDEQLTLLITSGVGQTDTTSSSNQKQMIILTGDIYINGDSVATSQQQLKEAFEKGIFIIKINNQNIKDLGYTYQIVSTTPSFPELTQPKTVAIIYYIAEGGYKLGINHPNSQERTVEINYINYPRSGETKISTSSLTSF